MSSAAVAVMAATTSNASTQAHRAREERECREFMGEFDSYTATVSEQKYYADCVDMIHPDPASDAEVKKLNSWLLKNGWDSEDLKALY